MYWNTNKIHASLLKLQNESWNSLSHVTMAVADGQRIRILKDLQISEIHVAADLVLFDVQNPVLKLYIFMSTFLIVYWQTSHVLDLW